MKKVIIDAIIKIAGEVGLENVTTKRIAQQLNISEGTIYRHFGSKEEFMRMAYLHICQQGDEFLKSLIMVNDNQLVDYYFDGCLSYWCNHPDHTIFACQFQVSVYNCVAVQNAAIKRLEGYREVFYTAFAPMFNYDNKLLDKFLGIAMAQLMDFAYKFAHDNKPVDDEEKAIVLTLLKRMTVEH